MNTVIVDRLEQHEDEGVICDNENVTKIVHTYLTNKAAQEELLGGE